MPYKITQTRTLTLKVHLRVETCSRQVGCSRPKAGPRPGRERGRRQLVVRHQRHQIRPVLDRGIGGGIRVQS